MCSQIDQEETEVKIKKKVKLSVCSQIDREETGVNIRREAINFKNKNTGEQFFIPVWRSRKKVFVQIFENANSTIKTQFSGVQLNIFHFGRKPSPNKKHDGNKCCLSE